MNDNGVWILAAGAGTVVAGNYIGTDATGTIGIGNGPTSQAGGDGVIAEGDLSVGVTIGGTVAGAGNVISANYIGVFITDSGSQGTSDVLVEGNMIGTNASGTGALPNVAFGIQIGDSSPLHAEAGNTIGGTTAAAMNLVSGNAGPGIELDGASTYGNLVEGNFIGTNLAGNAAFANTGGEHRLWPAGQQHRPGPLTPSAAMRRRRNVISSNTGTRRQDQRHGSGNLVEGNDLGTNAAGTAALANAGDGIAIDNGGSDNTIGGTAAGAGNVISGNATSASDTGVAAPAT